MGTVVKIALVAAVIGVGVWLYDYAQRTLNAFSFSIKSYGSPLFSGGQLQLPLQVAFYNPTPLPINLDNFKADISALLNNQWMKVGTVNEPLAIPSGESVQTITANFNFINFSPADLLRLFQKVQVKTEVTATYAGITLPTQVFTKEISIA